jgi:large subunit ribosomal protein L21
MYAIIETGGKQYKVEVGQELYVEKLDAREEDTWNFGDVIAVATEDGLKTGAPYVEGAGVEAKVVRNGKGKKINVFTYKPKKGEKRAMGHRQPYTKVEITAINA